MVISDERIIEMLFDRDEQALKIADKKYGPLCRRVAYNIIKNHEEVEGCVNFHSTEIIEAESFIIG